MMDFNPIIMYMITIPCFAFLCVYAIRKYNSIFMMLKDQRGWIYLDSLVGMVMLGVAILALALCFIQTTKGTLAVDNRTKASYIAQEQLERLRKYDATQKDRNNSVWATNKTLSAEQNHKTIFTATTSVVPADELSVTNLSTDVIPVKATVSWNEPSGPQQVQLITYYYYGSRS